MGTDIIYIEVTYFNMPFMSFNLDNFKFFLDDLNNNFPII